MPCLLKSFYPDSMRVIVIKNNVKTCLNVHDEDTILWQTAPPLDGLTQHRFQFPPQFGVVSPEHLVKLSILSRSPSDCCWDVPCSLSCAMGSESRNSHCCSRLDDDPNRFVSLELNDEGYLPCLECVLRDEETLAAPSPLYDGPSNELKPTCPQVVGRAGWRQPSKDRTILNDRTTEKFTLKVVWLNYLC